MSKSSLSECAQERESRGSLFPVIFSGLLENMDQTVRASPRGPGHFPISSQLCFPPVPNNSPRSAVTWGHLISSGWIQDYVNLILYRMRFTACWYWKIKSIHSSGNKNGNFRINIPVLSIAVSFVSASDGAHTDHPRSLAYRFVHVQKTFLSLASSGLIDWFYSTLGICEMQYPCNRFSLPYDCLLLWCKIFSR